MLKLLTLRNLFLAGFTLATLVVSPFILDFSLVPRFICLGIFIAALVYRIYRSNRAAYFQLNIITAAYIAYALFCCLSILWAINKAEALFEAARTLLALFVFLISSFVLARSKNELLPALLKLSLLILLVVLSVAAYQASGLKGFDKGSLYAITGNNGHKNLFASFLFLNLFFLVLAYRQLPGFWKILSGIGLLLSIFVLFFIKTKAVWIGLLVAGLVFAISFFVRIKSRKIKLNFYATLLLLLITANLFFIFLLQPLIRQGIGKHEADFTSLNKGGGLDQERLVIWDKTYVLFHKHPLIGVGAGNWQVCFPDATLNGLWRAEDLNYTFQRPHNDFLWMLSETGLIGFNLFLIFLFSLLLYLFKAIGRQPEKETRVTLCLCLAFIAGFCAISFFDFPKERIEHLVWINFIFAFAYHAIKEAGIEMPCRQLTLPKIIFIPVLGSLCFIILVGMLRYKGEYYTRSMLDRKYNNQPALLIASGASAQSFAYTLDPTSVPITWYTGNALTLLPDYKKVQADFEEAYALNPYNRNVLNDLASCYVYNNDVASAKKLYAEASRISPRFDEPKLNLAALYIREGNFRLADSCLSTLLHNSERRSNYRQMIKALQ